MATIQLETVSFSSDATEYWDEDAIEQRTDTFADKEKTVWVGEFESFEDCWEACDHSDVIVSETDIYKKELVPDWIDYCVKVYDGYNE